MKFQHKMHDHNIVTTDTLSKTKLKRILKWMKSLFMTNQLKTYLTIMIINWEHHIKTAGVCKLSGKLIIGMTYLNSLINKIWCVVLFDKCVVKIYLKLQTFNIVFSFVVCIR